MDNITYLKSQSRTAHDVSKNKPSLHPLEYTEGFQQF